MYPGNIARFWTKVNKTETCWLWSGICNAKGYGICGVGGEGLAHRVAYILLVGPIPKGLELDHLCSTRNCVNPTHLEPVDHLTNIRRGNTGIVNRSKTECLRGHPFTAENTKLVKFGRSCIACEVLYRETHREERRAYNAAYKLAHKRS